MKQLSELTNEELLQEAKKIKKGRILNAALIGFFVGIVLYSVLENTIGLFTLIPLFFIYKLANNSRYDSQEVEDMLKKRNVK